MNILQTMSNIIGNIITYVHDVIPFRVIEEPVVEECKFGIWSGHIRLQRTKLNATTKDDTQKQGDTIPVYAHTILFFNKLYATVIQYDHHKILCNDTSTSYNRTLSHHNRTTSLNDPSYMNTDSTCLQKLTPSHSSAFSNKYNIPYMTTRSRTILNQSKLNILLL